MIKKFNSFLNENIDVENRIDNAHLLENLLLQEKEIKVTLNDILYDSGIILELNNGIILENLAYETDWKEYDDEQDFTNETGATLKDYEGNKSEDLLELINSFDVKLDVVNAYFEGTPGKLLEIVLSKK